MITLLKKIKNNIIEFSNSEVISSEEKNFYLVMVSSIIVVLLIIAAFIIDGTNPIMCIYCFGIVLFVALNMVFSILNGFNIWGSYIYCFVLNIVIIPSMFFMSEGIYFGMTLFFILGLVLTVILIGNKKSLVAIITFLIIYDIAIVIVSFYYNNKVFFHQSNMSEEIALAFSFGMVSLMLIMYFLYQNYVHNNMRKIVEKNIESIQKAENTKGRFLANMTHEIRTPMNAIIGMTDLILKEDLHKNTREYTDTVKAASAQLLQIINNILEFSKLDSGRAELINNEYSFKKLVEEIVDNTSQVYSKEDIVLNVFINKDIPDRLFGDDVRIKQVLRYLLLSPLLRNRNGNVNLEINFDYDSDSRIITFLVRIASTGNGLSGEDMKAIYNAYSNYDSRQKTDYNRTGLEFSICQKIVNMMDGNIGIDSIEGIGNAVEFSLKNYVVDDKPIVNLSISENKFILVYLPDKKSEFLVKKFLEDINVAVTYVNSPLSFRNVVENRNFTAIYIPDISYPSLKEYIDSYNCEDKVFVVGSTKNCIGDFGKCKILRRPFYLFNFLESLNEDYDERKYKDFLDIEEIRYPYARVLCVDDSPVNLKVFESLLREYDITPKICTSGKEALSILEVDEFDILFVDQKMPEMDGIELAANIKKIINNNAFVPIICATADFGSDIREELIIQGFTDYLAKPINRIHLEKILKEYLPEELRVLVKSDNKKKNENDVNNEINEEPQIDPLEFNIDTGIANLGGNKDAYISVLLAYYNEGLQKLTEVPEQFLSGDISLFTTNVHALKSSSATVGCVGISPMFKALEKAGKENNIEYITNNSSKAFECLSEVLEKVREYLESENALVEEFEDAKDDRELIELDKELLNELSLCILTMNLRRSEEIIELLLANNYGAEVNKKVKAIKNGYDNFEYIKIKTIIEELL